MKQVLHVGSGTRDPAKLAAGFRNDDWQEIRLDVDPAVEPDIVASMLDMSGIPDQSFDAVYSAHNLEHLYAHEVGIALAEFARVLKPDGFAVTCIPDLQAVAALIAEDRLEEPAYVSPAGPIAPLDMVYGWRVALAQGNHFMAHKTGFTKNTLLRALVGHGFSQAQVVRVPDFDLWGVGYMSPVEEPRMAADRARFFRA